MSDTTYTYTLSGVAFEDPNNPDNAAGSLSGSVTVTYDGGGAPTLVAANLTTTAYDSVGSTDHNFTSYTYDLNVSGSADTVYGDGASSVTGPTNGRYTLTLYGTDNSHTLFLTWSGEQPTTLDVSDAGVTNEEQSSAGTRSITTAPGSSAGSITSDLACFAAGTKLLTERGEIPVEDLRIGDRLPALLSHRLAAVRWIGRRTVDAARHPRPWDVAPVRVHAEAFAPGQPARDLVLSPDHAVLADGGLVPIRYLLNGVTIVQEAPRRVTWYHIELDAHDVVLAEGLPAESYLDTGNRAAFENAGGAVMMTPEFARAVWAGQGCAPLVTDGPRLLAIRAGLLERLLIMGYAETTDPDLRVLADGTPLAGRAGGRAWHFDLPAGTRQVRLLSRHAVPAEATADHTDSRRLGVAIAGIALDGAPVPGTAHLAGWHPPEARLRWTTGDATLDVAGARRLEFTVALTTTYWVADTATPAERAA